MSFAAVEFLMFNHGWQPAVRSCVSRLDENRLESLFIYNNKEEIGS